MGEQNNCYTCDHWEPLVAVSDGPIILGYCLVFKVESGSSDGCTQYNNNKENENEEV